jgi:hypothetical protein
MALWTTAQVARELRLSENWVRDHAEELGGIRVSASKHSQLRFEPQAIVDWKERRRLRSRAPKPSPPPSTRAPRRRRRPLSSPLLELPRRGG